VFNLEILFFLWTLCTQLKSYDFFGGWRGGIVWINVDKLHLTRFMYLLSLTNVDEYWY